ncbi:MAG: biotin-dependent carboxyltransferase family protein [SAR202 cluster bacterium]|nr:biotin-dependent carboxyltransferase family protein [SAR202 cluster bacterium]
MSNPAIQVIESGMLTTVQDRGRIGYQRFGVPVSGAMDEFALRVANVLAGNDQNAAALEITVLGPRVRFLQDTMIALTGGDLSPQINDEPAPMWKTVAVARDSVLSFGAVQDGTRAYLAIAGGIDVPVVMGSRSTYVKAGIGGHEGRPLKPGDVLSTLPSPHGSAFEPIALPPGYIAPAYGGHHELRVVAGPQDDRFTAESLSTLLSARFSIGLDSDRMGYRLDGHKLSHVKGADIVSDGNAPGAIQAPGDGRPMILLADRGTTGGYTKIATVISTDLSKVAQALPGQTVSFKTITVEAAHQIYRERESIFAALRRMVVPPRLKVTIGRDVYEVVDEGGDAVGHVSLNGSTTTSRSRRVTAKVQGQSYEFEVEVHREEEAGGP